MDRVGFCVLCVLACGQLPGAHMGGGAGRAWVHILDSAMLTLLSMNRSCDLSVWDCSTADFALAC